MSKWQPIETVPKGSILMFVDEKPEPYMLVSTFDVLGDVYDTITHWMPLPSPPVSKPKDN